MKVPESGDPYNEIIVSGVQDFELKGDQAAVPLTFDPTAAFIVRTLLEQTEGFSKDLVVQTPDFREICGEAYLAGGRFAHAMSNLRFTLTALRSTLIEVSKDGPSNIYRRNPSYTVTDAFGLLRKTE